MADTPPTGTVTLMFTDIQNSTPLWERMGDRFRAVLDRHNDLLRESLQRWDGYEVKTQGDSFMAAFGRGTDAVYCALDIQRTLAEEAWLPEVGELLVRIGLHTGEPFLGYDTGGRPDYFGPMVNRAARLASAGHGGQILLSGTTGDVVQGALTGDVQLVDLGHHRLRGLEQTVHLFQVHHSDLPPRRFPPPRTLDALRHNLPVHLTTFVGREKELAELRELLSRPETRLLTLTGPGGSGKTRLAHQVASECAGEFTDGVWLVDFADVGEPDNVLPEMAAAVQLTLLPNRDPREQMLDFLRERTLLLVLDNFERAVGASLLLTDLLKAAPRVKGLVTSQIALRLRAERVVIVSPLETPDASITAPEPLLRFDSVALFVERAKAARADFEVTPPHLKHVAEICRQLEGIPLAIELAAAQVVDMSVVEVLEGLRSQLDVLWSESPDVPERHRTLRAAIDWSYRLLSPVEQQSLQQFSVFAGGWFREAAQAVCGPEGLMALRTLHRHSLVQTTEMADGRTRYFLLGMVREYARAKLDEQPELAREVAQRHARHYLDFARQRDAKFRTAEEVRALREMDVELENLRAAMDWVLEQGDAPLSVEFATALFQYLRRRGLLDEAIYRTEAVLRQAGEAADLLLNLASGYHDHGAWNEAESHARRALNLFEEASNQAGKATTLNLLGLIHQDRGALTEAQPLYEESLRLFRELGDRVGIANALHNLGYLAHVAGDLEAAARYYEESLTLRRELGDRHGMADTLNNLSAIAQIQGNLTDAARHYHDCLTIYLELGDRIGVTTSLHNLGEVAEKSRNFARAVALLLTAHQIFKELKSPYAQASTEALDRIRGEVSAEGFEPFLRAAEKLTEAEVVALARQG